LSIDTDLRDHLNNHKEDINVSSTTVGQDEFVYVTYTIDGGSVINAKVDDGSGGFVKTGNVESIEVETHGKDDQIDLSGVKSTKGYVAEKLNWKVKIKPGRGNGVLATNVDWEDMAFYQDAGTNYLYIADIGDNDNMRSKITIYRVAEPQIMDTPAGSDLSFQVIDLVYPNDGFGGMNGGRNSETFMIDPITGLFYIVTKSEPGRTKAHLYHIDKPAATDWKDDPANAVTKTLVDDGATRFDANTKTDSPSAGDVSPDGKEVVLKSDNVIQLYRYDAHNNTSAISIPQLLTQNEPTQLVNARDLQNRESVAFSPDGNTLYTVSENRKSDGSPRQIDSYARVTALIGTNNVNQDTLIGGTPTTGGGDSAGVDWTIGVKPGEVVDQQTSEKDLVLGAVGDMNFNGIVDFDDIAPFNEGLTDPAKYFTDWGIGAYVHGDTDGDGDIDFDDIPGFVALLGG